MLITLIQYSGRRHISHTEKNKEALLDAGKEAGLDANPEKTKYMLMPRYEKARQRHCI
jgi:hypothetical protein